MHGGADEDICDGGPGDDFVAGGQGGDTLIGDLGNDMLVFDAEDVAVEGWWGWWLYIQPGRPRMSDGPYAGSAVYYG